QKVLEEAINNSLSLSEIKQRVKALNGSKKALSESEPVSLKQRLTNTIEVAKKNKMLWSDPKKTQQLENLLSQLEAIVKN
ncbi:MAG: ParB/RepB/Spo0J family partition protein, partial [Nostoc sp.]